MTDPEYIRLLKHLDSTGWHNLVAIHPETDALEGRTFPPDSWADICDWVERYNGRWNLYSVNEPIPTAPHDKLSKKAIGAIRALHVDIDPPKKVSPAQFLAERQRIRGVIRDEMETQLETYPSSIIDSGGGFQVLFHLEAKLPAAEHCDRIESYNRGLVRRFDGDSSATDISRLLRLVGTRNLPTESKLRRGRKAAPATIVDLTDNAVTLDEMSVWAPPVPASKYSTATIDTEIDFAAVEDAETTGCLPDELARKFEQARTDNPRLDRLWNGEKTAGADTSGSAFTFDLAKVLRPTGGFTPTEFGQIVATWEYRSQKMDARQIARAWNRCDAPAPQEEFEAVESAESGDGIPTTKRKGLYFQPFEDTKPDLDETYLINRVFGHGTMVVTYGDSNVGKSFVAIDQAYHVAAGIPWNGHKVLQGLVVYVAAEGGKGFHKRLEALRIHHKVEKLPFALVPCPIDLQSDVADTNRLIKVVREAEAHYGQKCFLVVIDTLARAMGGGDENTAADMGKLVTHCDRLREAIGCTVNIVHHTGKDKSKGARGSSALRAATDTEIEIEPGVFKVQKQRDLEAIKPIPFALKVVEVGHRADGEQVTACVVEWQSSADKEFSPQLTPPQQQALDAFDLALSDKAKTGDKSGIVSPKEWRTAIASLKGTDIGVPSLLKRVGPVLAETGLIAKTKDGQYVRLAHE